MESLKRLVHLVNKGSRGQIHIFVGKVMRLWYIHSYSWASLDFTIGMQRQHQPLGSCQLPSCCSLRIVLSLLNAETSLAPNSVSVLVWLGLAPLQRAHATGTWNCSKSHLARSKFRFPGTLQLRATILLFWNEKPFRLDVSREIQTLV